MEVLRVVNAILEREALAGLSRELNKPTSRPESLYAIVDEAMMKDAANTSERKRGS